MSSPLSWGLSPALSSVVISGEIHAPNRGVKPLFQAALNYCCPCVCWWESSSCFSSSHLCGLDWDSGSLGLQMAWWGLLEKDQNVLPCCQNASLVKQTNLIRLETMKIIFVLVTNINIWLQFKSWLYLALALPLAAVWLYHPYWSWVDSCHLLQNSSGQLHGLSPKGRSERWTKIKEALKTRRLWI